MRDHSWNSLHCLLLKRAKGNFNTGSITIPPLDLPWMIWILLILLGQDFLATLCCILLIGVNGIAPVDLNTSMGTLQRQLFQQTQVLHDMKQAFDAQVLSLQAEQQRVQQDNVHLLHRLNTLPTPMSSGSPSRLDCPTFGSEDEAVDSKLGLHQFHAWRVQVVAWHAESTLAVSTRNVQVFTKLRGRAARVVAAKMPLDALRTDQGFQGLLGILEWAYGGDTADKILQAVVGLL